MIVLEKEEDKKEDEEEGSARHLIHITIHLDKTDPDFSLHPHGPDDKDETKVCETDLIAWIGPSIVDNI